MNYILCPSICIHLIKCGELLLQKRQKKINEQRKEIVGEPKNLEEQAISLVGRDIYEKLIKGYTENNGEEIVESYHPLL